MRSGPSARRARAVAAAARLAACLALACAHAEATPAPCDEPAAAPVPDPESAAPPPSEPSAPGPAAPDPAPAAPVAAEAAPPAALAPAPDPAPACGGLRGAAPPAFRWPARGTITSPFGPRGGRPHEGIDISSRGGFAVRAATGGTVAFSGRKPGYGRVIVLTHKGGYTTVYAHNQDNLVMTGTRVEQGELIADMGRTGEASGPHLHFEIRVANRPIDPLPCLPPRPRGR